MIKKTFRVEVEFEYGTLVKYRNPHNQDYGRIVSIIVREGGYVEYGVMWSNHSENVHNAIELTEVEEELAL